MPEKIYKQKPKNNYWNLVIFLIVVLIIAAGAYYFWVTSEKESEVNEEVTVVINQNNNLNTNQVSFEIYKDTDYNFQLEYPADQEIEEISTGEGENKIFTVSFGDSASISVTSTSMEGIVKNSISIDSEKEITIGGLKAARLEGGSLKDGSDVVMVLLNKDGKLYILQGYGQEFEQIVDSFSLL